MLCGRRALVGVEDPVELRPGDVARVFEALEPDTFAVLTLSNVRKARGKQPVERTRGMALGQIDAKSDGDAR